MSSARGLMRILPERLLLLLVVVLLEMTDGTSKPFLIRNRAENWSGDFLNFVKDMSAVVFRHKGDESRREREREYREREYRESLPRRPTTMYQTSTAPPNRIQQRQDGLLSTQKAALRDVLMMKLVSYYEDKYKVSHDIPTNDLTTRRPVYANHNKIMRPYERNRFVFETTRRYKEKDDIPEVMII